MGETYHVFVRSWYKSVPAGIFHQRRAWIPYIGRKTYLYKYVTYERALVICEEYNRTHKPGKRSRKAEFTRA